MTYHYHVGTGFTGYGPDAADGHPTLDTLRDALNYASTDLVSEADALYESASAAGEAKDYESAWLDFQHSESLRNLASNVDIDRRADAPSFTGPSGAVKLEATMVDLSAEFPVELDRNGSRRLYLWDCVEAECSEDDPES